MQKRDWALNLIFMNRITACGGHIVRLPKLRLLVPKNVKKVSDYESSIIAKIH